MPVYRISMFESGQDWGRKLFSMSKGDISRTSRAQRCSILPGQVNAFKASDNRMYRALMAILEQSSTRSSLVGTLGEPGKFVFVQVCLNVHVGKKRAQF